MREKSFPFDPGAALLLGLLIFTLRWSELTALIAAASIHEFGHWVCLKLMRVPVYGFFVTLSGPVLHCGDASSLTGKIMAALSGPIAGILLWAAIIRFWPLCAELSLFLSLMNLLPILPLDGGRVLAAVFPNRTLLILSGLVSATAVILSGLYLLKAGKGMGFFLFGMWLLMLACQGNKNDVK